MRYAIHIPPNTKDLAINLAMVAYGNPAKCNNVRTRKQLRFVASTEIFNGNQSTFFYYIMVNYYDFYYCY